MCSSRISGLVRSLQLHEDTPVPPKPISTFFCLIGWQKITCWFTQACWSFSSWLFWSKGQNSFSLYPGWKWPNELLKIVSTEYYDQITIGKGCQYIDYQRINNLPIPFYGEVVWNTDTGDDSYARFKIKKIENDMPIAYGFKTIVS